MEFHLTDKLTGSNQNRTPLKRQSLLFAFNTPLHPSFTTDESRRDKYQMEIFYLLPVKPAENIKRFIFTHT